MLKIGDFSKLSYISIRMLRYYDKHNILKPAYIEEDNNYRFYNVNQLEIANMIQKLKLLGFPLKAIKEMVDNKDADNINKHFNKRMNDIQNELENITRVSKEINQLIQVDVNRINYNVVKKTIPKRKVISLRKNVANYMNESILWNEIFEEIEKGKIKVLDDNYSMSIYHDQEYKEKNVDIEVRVSVDVFYKDTKNIKFYETTSMEVISIIFTGSYEKMPDVTKSAMLWIELNNYELI
ncbi:MAG: MerR family transcriptional regulator [Bacilli bacterium]|nr:MerR family transcriptional regulator [Bacilli bacterium]